MSVWAADGLKTVKPDQQTTKRMADIHYELARAYQKMEHKPEVIKETQLGLDMARKAKIETKRYEEQVAQFT